MKNPDNPRQRRLFYAMPHDVQTHPQRFMRALAGKIGAVILGSVPQSAGDGWDFWVDVDPNADLDWIGDTAPWKPIGQP